MARTLQELLDQADSAVGSQLDARVQSHLVNEAGHELCNMHEWSFLHRPAQLLSLTANQSYMDLPSDFARLNDVSSTNHHLNAVDQVNRGYLDWLRSHDVATSVVDWYVAVESPGQSSSTQQVDGPRLAIYPTPTSNTTDQLRIDYMAGWTELSNMDDVANIPADVVPLLTQIVRAYALGYMDERRGNGSVVNRMEPVYQSSMFQRLKERYGTMQVHYGQLRNGIVTPPWRTGRWDILSGNFTYTES